jgi:hypothetical protein
VSGGGAAGGGVGGGGGKPVVSWWGPQWVMVVEVVMVVGDYRLYGWRWGGPGVLLFARGTFSSC